MTYKHYQNRPDSVTPDFIRDEYTKIISRLDSAENAPTADQWLELYSDWNALNSFVVSENSRISHELSKDMTNEASEAKEKYFREQVQPVADEFSSQMVKALLASKHKHAVGERYGQHLIDVLETMVEPLAPINSELRVKLGELSTQYDKIVAKGEVEFRGEMMTLSKLRSLMTSENNEIRKEAFIAQREWFLANREAITTIYDKMVKLRDQMGRNLGHKNFIPLGYAGMGRTDYGVEEAKKFRENVRKYAVPLQTKLHEMRAKLHGTDTLKPWDAGYDPSMTLPSGIAPIGEQIEKAQRIFDKLSPVLAAHFMRMRSEGLIDLENRKGKRAGAYCTSFPDEGRVAILCNSTGDSEDIRTLTHEMGHAFQGWESQKIEDVNLQWPTSDACEVHSMGMEFLSMRYIEEYFDAENSAKYRKNRWRDAVEMMCYIVIVDEFQHWVYENPNATPDERDTAWDRIWDIYKPGIDFTGCEQYKHARWYGQGHIFGMPFYYIDYAIAETGAMQLGRSDVNFHEKVIESYIELCRIGGTMSVLNIFKAVGLRSPFDEENMKNLMEHAEKMIFATDMVEETV
jgi:M3 family oligoendopeptidase